MGIPWMVVLSLQKDSFSLWGVLGADDGRLFEKEINVEGEKYLISDNGFSWIIRKYYPGMFLGYFH